MFQKSEKTCIEFALKEYSSLPYIRDIDIRELERTGMDNSSISHIFCLSRRVKRSKARRFDQSLHELRRFVEDLIFFNIKVSVPFEVCSCSKIKKTRYLVFQLICFQLPIFYTY